MKKTTKIGSVVLEYLTRNTKYEVIPAGYYSKQHIMEINGFSVRKFSTFIMKAKKLKLVELKWFRVANGARCVHRPYYKLSPEICKLMGLASR